MLHIRNQKQNKLKPQNFYIPMLFSKFSQGFECISKHQVWCKVEYMPMVLFNFYELEFWAYHLDVGSNFRVLSKIGLF